jgi:hypothetical protein
MIPVRFIFSPVRERKAWFSYDLVTSKRLPYFDICKYHPCDTGKCRVDPRMGLPSFGVSRHHLSMSVTSSLLPFVRWRLVIESLPIHPLMSGRPFFGVGKHHLSMSVNVEFQSLAISKWHVSHGVYKKIVLSTPVCVLSFFGVGKHHCSMSVNIEFLPSHR